MLGVGSKCGHNWKLAHQKYQGVVSGASCDSRKSSQAREVAAFGWSGQGQGEKRLQYANQTKPETQLTEAKSSRYPPVSRWARKTGGERIT